MSYIYTHEEFQYSSERFHMNWGWNGTNDGFYSDGSLGLYLDNKYYNFDNDRQEIINIYPPR
ncbi:hypothetical protein D0T85_17450 [Bacteroides sp. 519]|nr:hypothetical protein [Bacteroides sp. 519]